MLGLRDLAAWGEGGRKVMRGLVRSIETMGENVMLFNSLIKAFRPIPERNHAVHGITDDMVRKRRQTWPEVNMDRGLGVAHRQAVVVAGLTARAFERSGGIDVMARFLWSGSPDGQLSYCRGGISPVGLAPHGSAFMQLMRSFGRSPHKRPRGA